MVLCRQSPIRNQVCPYQQFVLTAEFVLWKGFVERFELITYIEGLQENEMVPLFTRKFTNKLYSSIDLITNNAERKLTNFTKNYIDTVEVLAPGFPGRTSFVCVIFKREPFFFIQFCAIVKCNPIAFCINRTSNTNFVCNNSFHRGIIYRRLGQKILKSKHAVLCAFLKPALQSGPTTKTVSTR